VPPFVVVPPDIQFIMQAETKHSFVIPAKAGIQDKTTIRLQLNRGIPFAQNALQLWL
jgi:hypothetical protein